jgi:hypothetical protein
MNTTSKLGVPSNLNYNARSIISQPAGLFAIGNVGFA